MKVCKFFSLIMFLSCFSGCGGNFSTKKVIPVLEFDCKAEIKTEDLIIKCNISRNLSGIVKINIFEPKELENFNFSLSKDHQEIKFQGLNFKIQEEILPEESFASIITNILNHVSKLPEFYTVTLGEVNDIKYSVNFSPETGKISKLNVDSLNLEVKFI